MYASVNKNSKLSFHYYEQISLNLRVYSKYFSAKRIQNMISYIYICMHFMCRNRRWGWGPWPPNCYQIMYLFNVYITLYSTHHAVLSNMLKEIILHLSIMSKQSCSM